MKHLETILKKQFELIGLEYSEEFTKKDNWYLDHYWTEESLNKFKKWMFNYLWNNKAARDHIMDFPLRKKERIKKTVDMWEAMYGWRIPKKT